MAAFPSYSTGTVSVGNGDPTIVVAGAILSGGNAMPGDDIVILGHTVIVQDVIDIGQIEIDPWPYDDVAPGTPYKIVQRSPQRYGSQELANVRALLNVLRVKGLLWYLDVAWDDPSEAQPPLTAVDGQGILQIATGKLWVMQGGAWTFSGVFRGISPKGAFDNGTVYSANDMVSSAGSSYVWINETPGSGHAPPNATYWQVVGEKGDKGDKGDTGASYAGTSTTSLAIGPGSKAFTTQAGLAYLDGARVRASSDANTSNWMEGIATYSGTILTIAVSKTNGSGTYADWNFNVAGEPGAGDMTSSNYASEYIGHEAQVRANIAAQALGDYAGMSNGTLVASASAGALTVAVKTFAGADPSAADPVYFYFRDSTLTSGAFTRIAVTSARSVVIGSTKTLGAVNGTGVRVWITAHNNAGTVQLGAINCSDTSGVFCPQEHVKYTTAVPGNASRAFYTTSAIATAAPMRLLGFCEWNSLTTAGMWVAPEIVQLLGPGVCRPGQVVQTAFTKISTVTTITTNTPTGTDLIAGFNPTSTANLVRGSFTGSVQSNNTNHRAFVAVFRNGAAFPNFPLSSVFATGSFASAPCAGSWLDKPNSTSLQNYRVFLNNDDNASTVSFPDNVGTGQQAASMTVDEIMG
ncbi:hypothetical protein [Bradyrhizobium sp. Ai1a-2]|uniref:hypothetical protein n=1 Tax=Bradyrhizobium sp. Ai1a-2 TaxID=196490 RepID=UPI00040FE6A9|nr:hypothetical protein [Bradyrhizobium sp. Ai1a-2]